MWRRRRRTWYAILHERTAATFFFHFLKFRSTSQRNHCILGWILLRCFLRKKISRRCGELYGCYMRSLMLRRRHWYFGDVKVADYFSALYPHCSSICRPAELEWWAQFVRERLVPLCFDVADVVSYFIFKSSKSFISSNISSQNFYILFPCLIGLWLFW